jgi:hypothetical protein
MARQDVCSRTGTVVPVRADAAAEEALAVVGAGWELAQAPARAEAVVVPAGPSSPGTPVAERAVEVFPVVEAARLAARV